MHLLAHSPIPGYHASEKTGEPPINPVNLVLMKSLTELVLSFLYIASNHAVAIQCGNYIKNSWNSIGLDNMNGITSITLTHSLTHSPTSRLDYLFTHSQVHLVTILMGCQAYPLDYCMLYSPSCGTESLPQP